MSKMFLYFIIIIKIASYYIINFIIHFINISQITLFYLNDFISHSNCYQLFLILLIYFS